MPDWKQIVGDRLGALHLPAETKDDVVAELALHLEEVSENARNAGLSGSAATALALEEVQNWRALAAQISRARSKEGVMNRRIKSLWLPAMAGVLGAGLAVTALHWIDVSPHYVFRGSYLCHAPSGTCAGIAISFYWPWLAATPAIGALGAYLSRRAGGRVGSRLLAGLAPALLIFLGSFLTQPVVPIASFSHYYFYCVTNWVLIPGLLLLLGALPFLQKSPQQQETAK